VSDEIIPKYNDPILFGIENSFMTLGALTARGINFLVFYHLKTGKTYIEEEFHNEINGEFVLGLEEVKDDNLWIALVQKAQSSGLISIANILYCMDKLNISYDKKQIANLLTNASSEQDFKLIKEKT
jgi:hypothetical protein